jgi:hypothetical protein
VKAVEVIGTDMPLSSSIPSAHEQRPKMRITTNTFKLIPFIVAGIYAAFNMISSTDHSTTRTTWSREASRRRLSVCDSIPLTKTVDFASSYEVVNCFLGIMLMLAVGNMMFEYLEHSSHGSVYAAVLHKVLNGLK